MIQIPYQAVFLEQRNKQSGADHPDLRVDPPHQGFGAGKHRDVRPDIELRLIVDDELLLPDGLVKVLGQLFGEHLPIMQAAVVVSYILRIVVPHQIRGGLGPVEALLHAERLVHIRIDAQTKTYPVFLISAVRDPGRGRLQNRGMLVPMRAVDHKGVRCAPAHDAARLLHHFPQIPPDLLKRLIRKQTAVPLVDQMEVVDVQHTGVHRFLLMVLVKGFGVIIKELPVVKACQRVPLG